ncbi:hypothetical protein L9F63_022300, partial [Diploptera punctata]
VSLLPILFNGNLDFSNMYSLKAFGGMHVAKALRKVVILGYVVCNICITITLVYAFMASLCVFFMY